MTTKEDLAKALGLTPDDVQVEYWYWSASGVASLTEDEARALIERANTGRPWSVTWWRRFLWHPIRYGWGPWDPYPPDGR